MIPDTPLETLPEPATPELPGMPEVVDQVALALQQVGLTARVAADRDRWQALEGLWALPWAP